ncbi:30S ribosomal protein S7 [Candidatus Gottesmanbacteria bacterium RIFCSPLOWO2_01_FULL_48_11]|uniref:Small ribosomal subunit protein uS7 n=3 Tax=Candidatus Gottesmaniibacteriota TaxID=1752720 RepID=A0A0G1UNS2_9BACT|nr:MAG: 30S ribosomal protein S7 [Candidatus Gottesmanbacteria bacterium GW2011_GWA2_47_9]KKU95882.1 MAG: 30S ribosomal protein S7 [Candidatus Gottesmanbacteria bacterium GW2011_GWA1_48_13]OGG26584.1 MAG: 30S ribosomal protein S7 [Candidatus Gottesmanbacteria bacterium RIFCSPLOWO2_01_FULL_48_11]
MRGKRVKKLLLVADPIYGNRLLTRFVNRVMESGKKRIAEGLVYGAFDLLREKGEDPIKVFETAIATVGPKMEVKARRVGGASYQVPTEVRGDRRVALAMRWIIQFAKKRANKEYKTFAEKLAVELLDASKGQGEAIKKRDTMHRMAEANRAFAHFKW